MEPTIQSTIQQQPINSNQPIKFAMLIMIGIVAIIGAYFVFNNAIRTENRAAENAPELTCENTSEGAGYCEIKDIPANVNIDNLILSVVKTCAGPGSTSSTGVVYRQKIKSRVDRFSDKFPVDFGCTYTCQIELEDPLSGNSEVCPGGVNESLTCEGPTITPPCPDCVDGTIACEGPKVSPLKAGKVSSCPALAVHNVKYTEFSGNACSNQTPSKLDCATDEVWIESTQDPTERRKLTKTECDLFKSGNGYDIRLHTALGETCREYEVQIYRKDQGGNWVRFDELCDNCELKSGCPVACEAPVELAKTDLEDISYINSKFEKLKGTETVECGIVPDSNPEINCELDINQNACGKQIVFTPRANGTIYLDDQYNKLPRIVIPAVKDLAVPFTYENAGHYDVVFSCGDPENGKIEQVCAKRITVACGDNPPPPPPPPPGSPTPTQPISCPEVPLEGVCI